jgi:signal transduction histidine kinase
MKYSDKELLNLIMKYSTKIMEQRSVDDLLNFIAEFAREIVNSDRCSIWLVDQEHHLLWTKVAEGVNEETKIPLSIPWYSGVVGYAFLNKKDIIINDPYSSDIFYPDIDKVTGYKTQCLLAVPIQDNDGNIIGIAQVINKKDNLLQEFDESDKEYLKIAVSYLSGALNILKLQNENREKDKILFQQSKMAEMGGMVASIIHQWKQPLNIINLNNQKLELFQSLGKLNQEEVLKTTQIVNSQIKHINETMNVFRDFFKPNQEKEQFNIEKIFEDIKLMIEKLYNSHGVHIYFTISSANINGYPNELKQVLINILNNARDIILENKSENKNIYINSHIEEEKLIIEIQDFAGGIPENIIDKIFDPYFTTKDEDKGTGIGLDMSKEIIKKANGTIEVKNKTNQDGQKGACFTIKIPIN